jgi:hypothetical protein
MFLIEQSGTVDARGFVIHKTLTSQTSAAASPQCKALLIGYYNERISAHVPGILGVISDTANVSLG